MKEEDKHTASREEAEYIYITDEDGNEQEFEILMTFELDDNGHKYMMVTPTDVSEDDELEEVYAFRYEEQGDDLQLYLIEDDDEWDIVEETFNTMMAEASGEED